MKHSILALPALLRSAIFLAAASQTTFSVQDDLLAFPQYEVHFSEDYLSESQAKERLSNNQQLGDDTSSHLAQYRPPDDTLNGDSKRTDEVKLEYESMILDGQRYLCSIPQIKKPEPQQAVNETLSKADEEKELARATDRGWELISGMQGNCVYYISGWWSYRFCYNDAVRQFHQLPPSRGVPVYPPMEDPAIEGFTLGRYKEGKDVGETSKQQTAQESGLDVATQSKKAANSSALGKMVQRGESRYLVQTLDGGTKCDLTGRDRRIEVQFHCNPSTADRISLIKETSTCTYLMVIQTPRLCNDIAFLPPEKNHPNPITCYPILGSEADIAVYKSNLASLHQAEASANIAQATAEAAKIFRGAPDSPPQQVVGDIAVGAHTLVPPGTKLEKSSIVGGGKETYIDTLASSDGKVLSKEALEKLGIGDPKAVEQWTRKLEEIAGEQEWRLALVDTPRGREYRGIIGSQEEEEQGEKKDPVGEGGEGAKGEGAEGEEGSREEYFHEEL